METARFIPSSSNWFPETLSVISCLLRKALEDLYLIVVAQFVGYIDAKSPENKREYVRFRYYKTYV